MKRFPKLEPIPSDDLADAAIAQRDMPMPPSKEDRYRAKQVVVLLAPSWAKRDTSVRKVESKNEDSRPAGANADGGGR